MIYSFQWGGGGGDSTGGRAPLRVVQRQLDQDPTESQQGVKWGTLESTPQNPTEVHMPDQSGTDDGADEDI